MKAGEQGSVLKELMKKLVGLGMGLSLDLIACLSLEAKQQLIDRLTAVLLSRVIQVTVDKLCV